MPRNVSRLAGFIDLGGLALFVAGAASYFRAYIGMRHLEAGTAVLVRQRFAEMTEYARLVQLSRIGLALAVFALAMFVAGAIIARRKVVATPA